jgi:hypothetical protein
MKQVLMVCALWLGLSVHHLGFAQSKTDQGEYDEGFALAAPYLNISREKAIALGRYCDNLADEKGIEKMLMVPECARFGMVGIYLFIAPEPDEELGNIVPQADAGYLYTSIKKFPQARDFILSRATRDAGSEGKAIARDIIRCADILPGGLLTNPERITRDCQVAMTRYFQVRRFSLQELAELLRIAEDISNVLEKVDWNPEALPNGAWDDKKTERFFRILIGVDGPSREDWNS